MVILVSVYLFTLGLALGSFALVLATRMHFGKDWVKGRSHCESCKHVLAPLDLIPVFSWLAFKGRCRYCKAKLSFKYPLIEITLGIAFVLSYIYWPMEFTNTISVISLAVWLMALVIMSALFVSDIKWQLLPNKQIYPLVYLGFLWALLDFINNGFSFSLVGQYALSILVGGGLFLLFLVYSKGKWIGDGDVRLGVAIGLFAKTPVMSWLTIFIASTLGVLVSIPIIFNKKSHKHRLKIKIPFGPVLIVALIIVVLFGQSIIDWYSTSLLLF